MPDNLLVTGRPCVGKTTVVERLVELARDDGGTVRGVVTPEVREDGERVGFEMRSLSTDRTEMVASADFDREHTVGKYGVDTEAVATVTRAALDEAARSKDDLVVIDEIAPMQTASQVFVENVRRVFDSETSVVAVVQEEREMGFVGKVKRRSDTEVFVVTEENRDEMPKRLFRRLS